MSLKTPDIKLVYPEISECELDFSNQLVSEIPLKHFLKENIPDKIYIRYILKNDNLNTDDYIKELKHLNIVNDIELNFCANNDLKLHTLLKYKVNYLSILSQYDLKNREQFLKDLENFDHNFWETSLYGILYKNIFGINILDHLAFLSIDSYSDIVKGFDFTDYFMKNYPCKDLIIMWTKYYFIEYLKNDIINFDN